jgi:acetoin utilization deacetylase AcuC-like enzyme
MNPYSLQAACAPRARFRPIRSHKAQFGVLRRPPPAIACRARMGFCIFNNVAVAARHALAAHGLERVAMSTSVPGAHRWTLRATSRC